MSNSNSKHLNKAGIAREAHFAAGGDLKAWRGRKTVIPDGKKKASKNACRNKSW